MSVDLKKQLDERLVKEKDEERRRDIQTLRDIVEQFNGAVQKLDRHIDASQDMGEALKLLGENPKETIAFFVKLRDILGEESQIKKRNTVLDKLVEKEEKRIALLDLIQSKFISALATELGKNSPRSILLLVVLYTVGLDKLLEGWAQIKTTILERLI